MTAANPRGLRFPATIFLSAFLLFQVQPIIARYLLPWFGGSPAVWTTCLLFFQAALLGGYLYAHWLGLRASPRLQATVHTALLAASLLLLPIAPNAGIWKPATSSDPTGRILLLLTATVGAPYFLLSATAPLLQRWYNRLGRSPWRLYALSNLGSFLALLSYPFAVEPFVRLRTQVWIWSALYAVFAMLCVRTAWKMASSAPSVAEAEQMESDADTQPGIWTILFWLALSAAGSTLLLATTNQISQEIAVNPFLWVAPLSIYLLTFVLTFESPRWYRRHLFAVFAGLLAAIACAVNSAAIALSLWIQIVVYVVTLFAACMVCHGELVRSRPAPSRLTGFYLTVAAGGVLGGIFAALIAPRVFTQYSEYQIGLAAACLLGLMGWMREGALKSWTSRNIALRVPIMALLMGGFTSIAATTIKSGPPAIVSLRNFYGILRVQEQNSVNGPFRKLTHGRITHGFQYLDAAKRDWPTSYYGPHSGAAIALNALFASSGSPKRIAVVGLGTGTLAVWGRPGDTIRFYEINPDVVNVARTWFSYLKDSKARTEVVLGDARVQLERELAEGHAHDFDAIAVDAFSSDSIPLHLLTAECADIYRDRLAPDGILLLHISNRTLNLEPVARGLARHLGWKAVQFLSGQDDKTGESQARWVLISANSAFLTQDRIADEAAGWTQPARPPLIWTDDYASLWHVLKF